VSAIGKIALHVTDADRAEASYRDTLGLTRPCRFGQPVFFDCGGVRLMRDRGHATALPITPAARTLAAKTSPRGRPR
jgi:methylmalonyl-CoA/ethylmalonyl-CoA epimerase